MMTEELQAGENTPITHLPLRLSSYPHALKNLIGADNQVVPRLPSTDCNL
jgi:hypothetical protein